ncbi:MAG: threonine--tRNA ligase [Candidatus Pacearchaeota archaeon]|nr:threonine--tRNA ligase [Candidatus Pacearchaeota archaeon]
MKILCLHVDYINFKPLKKALKNVAELSEKEKKGEKVAESLVVLTAVEKGDVVKESVKKLVENVEDIAKQVKIKTIVLYPYAHLSSNLASPEIAEEILREGEKELKKKFRVVRAPFGYYKEFELKVKGHPLSELSREIKSGIISGNEKEKKEIEEYNPQDFLHEIKQSKLDTSKLKDNDHRIIGQEMELFLLNQSSPGMVYWLPNGTIIYNELIKFWREEHQKLGYQETITPLINKSALYKVSGHWAHYKEHMFIANTDEGEYGVKAMNCPNAMVIFGSKPRSYKELPLRLSDTDRLHRYELSGTLGGLLRVRSFQQDDSHNFVAEEQIKDEYNQIIKICDKFYSIFGMKYFFRLGTRPEKFMGDVKLWDKAEKELKEILKQSGKKFSILKGDGAFYGPKIDILMEDSLGREWQMGTIQLDMQMPLRFGLKYVDKDNKERTPIVIHRVIYGSLERFIAILLEHTNGRLPTWLAPIQIGVLSFTDRNIPYAKKIVKQLGENIPNLRINTDFESTTVGSKVKNAEIMRIPYIIVIGDKEEKDKTIAVRIRGDSKIKTMKIEGFIRDLKTEIENRK